jgi:hypothetical protein
MRPEELMAWHHDLGAAPAPPAPTWRTTRGRTVDLAACSTVDLYRALEQLERDTCMDGGCRPGEPCRRHTRRKRG